MLRGLDQKKPEPYGYGHWELISRVRKDMQSMSCDMVVGEVSCEVYLPQLACCAGKPSPYVVCQLRRRSESCTIVRVREQSVVVDLYVEIRICGVIRGRGVGILGCSVLRHSGHHSSIGSLAQSRQSLCLGSQLRFVSAGVSKHMRQSSGTCSLSSAFPAFLGTSSSGCWGGGVASRSGNRALWTSISMSLGGVVCVARSTAGAAGPGLDSVSPSWVGSWTQLVDLR